MAEIIKEGEDIGNWDCGWLRGASDESIRRAQEASMGADSKAMVELKCEKPNCKIGIQTFAEQGKAVKQVLVFDSTVNLFLVYKAAPH